jgi:glutamyl-tRNA synthetase
VPLSIRWEDIDRERSKPSWIEIQKNDLKKIGIIWQQEFLQSENHHRHREAFDVALKRGQVYPCFCTRQEVQNAVQALASAPQRAGEQRVYSGACRNLTSAEVEQKAAHFPHRDIGYRIRIEGEPSGTKDFLVARENMKESVWTPAYHWACALDDGWQNYRWLVRAWDLESADRPQRHVRDLFGLMHPEAIYTALVVQGPHRVRLEKRSAGLTLEEWLKTGRSVEDLIRAFEGSVTGDFEASEVNRELSVESLFQ